MMCIFLLGDQMIFCWKIAGFDWQFGDFDRRIDSLGKCYLSTSFHSVNGKNKTRYFHDKSGGKDGDQAAVRLLKIQNTVVRQ